MFLHTFFDRDVSMSSSTIQQHSAHWALALSPSPAPSPCGQLGLLALALALALA
eukprot:CAMPEP_0113946644 /NCGR_PEP_ID=MMETSP1339-20121228/59183_1 /TAXON_ID=94617 /ORGANISM="Fibrocapsa japonica" /LENGTH=53 /DNA_ID=CAMNT_0000952851 /DNA_START=66 /DNA_END=225 /DNA_ORIENTATION=+ /assembly_acc=CAM_ASM_000762